MYTIYAWFGLYSQVYYTLDGAVMAAYAYASFHQTDVSIYKGEVYCATVTSDGEYLD